jgi:hypothetical protein
MPWFHDVFFVCQPISVTGTPSSTSGLIPQYPRNSAVERDSISQNPNECSSYSERLRAIHARASSRIRTPG